MVQARKRAEDADTLESDKQRVRDISLDLERITGKSLQDASYGRVIRLLIILAALRAGYKDFCIAEVLGIPKEVIWKEIQNAQYFSPLFNSLPAPAVTEPGLRPIPLKPHLNEIFNACAKATGITFDKIMDISREAPVVHARDAAIYLTRELTGMSYPEITKALGRTSHSTWIASCDRFAQCLKDDDKKEAAESLLKRVRHELKQIVEQREKKPAAEPSHITA